MCLATIGFYGTKGPFWAMPTMLLTGSAAAGGLAFINSFGNIGGAVGPAVVGWLKDATGSYAGGLYGLAMFTAVSAVAPEAEAAAVPARKSGAKDRAAPKAASRRYSAARTTQ